MEVDVTEVTLTVGPGSGIMVHVLVVQTQFVLILQSLHSQYQHVQMVNSKEHYMQ